MRISEYLLPVDESASNWIFPASSRISKWSAPAPPHTRQTLQGVALTVSCARESIASLLWTGQIKKCSKQKGEEHSARNYFRQ